MFGGHWIRRELQKEQSRNTFWEPLAASALLIIGGFFVGFAFSNIKENLWFLAPSIAVLAWGVYLDVNAAYRAAKVSDLARSKLAEFIKIAEKDHESTFGVRSSSASWHNSLQDQINELQKQVKKLKEDIDRVKRATF